eukprot:808513-Pelagomonas_calceolata.AAC.2
MLVKPPSPASMVYVFFVLDGHMSTLADEERKSLVFSRVGVADKLCHYWCQLSSCHFLACGNALCSKGVALTPHLALISTRSLMHAVQAGGGHCMAPHDGGKLEELRGEQGDCQLGCCSCLCLDSLARLGVLHRLVWAGQVLAHALAGLPLLVSAACPMLHQILVAGLDQRVKEMQRVGA